MELWCKLKIFLGKFFGKNKQKKVQVIFLLGPSGSGKTTNARLYRNQHSDCCLIRVSHLLREEIKSSKKWWMINWRRRIMAQNFEKAIKAGKLTDAAETWLLIKRSFQKAKNGFVIVDGFPRSLDYYQQIQAEDCQVLGLIYLDVPSTVARERMRSQSGNRVDNTEAAMKSRAKFVESMRPVLEEFARQNKLCRIDSSGTVEQTQTLFAAAVSDLRNE